MDNRFENGYTMVPHEVIEALMRLKLSPSEYRIVLAVIRKTFGFHKDWDRISYSQFSCLTGLNRNQSYRSVKRLINRSILECRSNKGINKLEYRLNQDYDVWNLVNIVGIGDRDDSKNSLPNRGLTVSNSARKVSPKLTRELSPKQDNTKDIKNSNTKNNYKNKKVSKESFLKNKSLITKNNRSQYDGVGYRYMQKLP